MEFRTDFRLEFLPENKVRTLIIQGARPQFEQTLNDILVLAQEKVGTNYSGHHPEREKRLAESGRVEVRDGIGYVIFDHPIAYMHHEGAQPHTFEAKDPESAKPFYVRRKPEGYRFGPRRGPFGHPGTTGNPYLVDAGEELAKRSGSLMRGRELVPIFRSKGSF